MNVKLIQQALNAAIHLDIKNAREHLDMTLEEHAEASLKLIPNLSKVVVIVGKLNMDNLEAEAN